MSLRDRFERQARQLAEDARSLRITAGFDVWAGGGRPGILTMADVDLERAEEEVVFVLEQIRKTRAAKEAAKHPAQQGAA